MIRYIFQFLFVEKYFQIYEVLVDMDKYHKVKQYGSGFIEYHLHPFTTQHLLFVLIYTILSSYLYAYLFRYPLFKWMYLGSIIMFIGFVYGDHDNNVSGFKLGTP
jgi:hypothetical protein